MKTSLLITAFLIGTLRAASGQTNATDPAPIKAELGKEILIPCNYELSEGEILFSITWKHGADDVVVMGSGVKSFQGNYEERADVDTNTYDLTLANLTLDDAGSYTCSMVTTEGSTTTSQEVEILASPQVSTRVIPKLVGDGNNEKVTLAECMATSGSSPFTMKWINEFSDSVITDSFRIDTVNPENEVLLDSTLPLTIMPDPDRNNGRTFYCEVTDAFGNSKIESAILSVAVLTTTPPTTTMQASPMFTSFPTGDTIEMKLGENRNFECDVTGVPTPSVSWYKGTQKLAEDIGTATLKLKPMTYEDSGEYTCIGKNQEGEIQRSFQLDAQGAPVILTEENLGSEPETITVDQKWEIVSLSCQASANPLATIEWVIEDVNGTDVKVSEDIDPASNVVTSTVNISTDQFASGTRRVKCVASNSLNETSKEFIVISPLTASANTGLIVGVVIAVIIILALVFFIVFFTLTSRRRQKADLASGTTAEDGNATFFSGCCSKKKLATEASNETDGTDQVKEVREEGTSEEKQKLTEAEEQPAEKDSDNSEDGNPDEEEAVEEAKEKKKRRIPFPSQCCRGNKKEQKEEENHEEENKGSPASDENGHTPQDEEKVKKANDGDSGKGDTLEKVVEAEK